jgi:peptidoglycan/LPS O-acetylase OafA/YrhL
LILTGLAMGAALTIISQSKSGMDITYDYGFARCIYGFATGAIAHRLCSQMPSIPGRLATAAEIFTVAAAFTFVALAAETPAAFAAPLVFAAVVLVFSSEAGAISRLLLQSPLQRLGDWSYSIYMVHAFIAFAFGLAASLVQRKWGMPLWQTVIESGVTKRVVMVDNVWLLDGIAIVYLAVVIALASQTYRFVEQPGRHAFNAIATRIRSSNTPISRSTGTA